MRLVLVPLAMLSTPQQLAVLVNFWSLMSTSRFQPGGDAAGQDGFFQPGFAAVDFADFESDVAAGFQNAVQLVEDLGHRGFQSSSFLGTVSFTDLASMPRNQQRSQLSVA